jgi:hypothetical protein
MTKGKVILKPFAEPKVAAEKPEEQEQVEKAEN